MPLADLVALKGDRTVSVLVPALNEEPTVAGVVAPLVDLLVPAGLVDEVVVVDGGSTDRTAEAARAAGARVLHLPTQAHGHVPAGKGGALWWAQQHVAGDLLVTALQLVFLASLFVWARGTRLGAPRDEPATWHRSSLEYVQAMGALTRNAGVEGELVQALKTDFRRFLREAAAIPEAWSWEDADGELARRQSLPAGALIGAAQQTSFVALSQALARLENQLRHG